MSWTKHFLLALACGATAWAPGTARADLLYTAGAGNFPVVAGSTVSVPIYIQESGPTQEITAGGGLLSAGFAVQHVAPGAKDDAVFGGANFDSNGDPVGGFTANLSPSAFFAVDDGSSYSDASASLAEDVFNPDFTGGPGNPNNNPVFPASPGGLLLLGYVNVQAASTAGQVSSFSIGDFDSDSSVVQTLTNSYAGLDGSIAGGGFTVTAVAVPEPGASAVAVAALAGLGVRRRGRRRASPAPARDGGTPGPPGGGKTVGRRAGPRLY